MHHWKGDYAVIGVTLADRPHYVPPKGESFGGPDNWAAATGWPLVEGLAGVRNEGLAFSTVALSPVDIAALILSRHSGVSRRRTAILHISTAIMLTGR